MLMEKNQLMGKYQNSIDAKSRMVVPAKFRGLLGLRCVITTGLDGCLYIYSMEEWDTFVKKLSKLPMSDPKARKFSRYFFSNAVDQEIDRQGRVTIPQELRLNAGITKELVTVGCNTKVEVWSKERWDAMEENEPLDIKDIEEGMEKYEI